MVPESSVSSIGLASSRTSVSGWRALNRPIRPTSQVAAKDGLELITRNRRPFASRIARAARREDGETLGKPRRAGGARLGQREPPTRPLDQRRADLLFERPHLLRDRRLGDMQLLGGAGERQLAGDRLEGAQRGQRRQAVNRSSSYSQPIHCGNKHYLERSNSAIYPMVKQGSLASDLRFWKWKK